MGLDTSRIANDEGQSIRANNFSNPAPNSNVINGNQGSTNAEPTGCILITNMFDSKIVDLNKDPNFFLEIKEQVYDCFNQWGELEKVYVEQNSDGHVWVKFSGDAIRSSANSRKELDGKYFDNMQLSVHHIDQEVFKQKIREIR